MIGNTNASKQPTEFVDVPKYVGVASVKIVAVNPNNDKLRVLGWNIPEGAEEPKYVVEKAQDDGTLRKSARVRFMAQIQDFDDKPIVALDFWISPGAFFNRDSSKCQIIDSYGRTAWATKEELKNGTIPQYSSGPANIATPYKPAHRGEERLVKFLMKYLCCTPFEVKDRNTGKFIRSANPGQLTIDNWQALCNGNASEIVQYLASQPDNRVKVILGISQTDDNKSYQAFVDDLFIANGSRPENGVYPAAERAIDALYADGYHDGYQYSAHPVKPFIVTPTDVKPASNDFEVSDSKVNAAEIDAMFSDNAGSDFDDDDLPFA